YMWRKSVLDLSESEVDRVHNLMEEYNVEAVSIQTQIMKTHPPDSQFYQKGSKDMHKDFEYNISRIDDAIKMANEFKADYIITYSFFKRDPSDVQENWKRLFEVYSGFLPKLKANHKKVVVECESDTYIAGLKDYLEFLGHFNSEHILANFDVANFLETEGNLTEDDFKQLEPFVEYFHVKDRIFLDRHSRSAIFGEGDVPWKQIINWSASTGKNFVLSVEPHVHGWNRFKKASKCALNLQKLLKEMKLDFK
ncbi:MAG: sugar phosphate isomerase/epimerase family protein, partial [Promethearchaeota archaeon]